MKNRYYFFIALLGFIILFSNLNPIQYLISIFLDENYYQYSNYNGSFTTKEHVFKGTGFRGVKNEFKNYKLDSKSFKKSNDTLLYRLFLRNPLRFWHWKDYFLDERYQLPYKNWKEIRERRGYDIKGYWRDYQKF